MGGSMAYRVRDGAAVDRAWPHALYESSDFSSIAPGNVWPAEYASSAEPTHCPELDCLRGLVAADIIAGAERRAARVGVGAECVLIAAGTMNEESYLRRLGARLGIAFETLDDVARAQCPIDDDRLIKAAAAGLVPLLLEGELRFVLVPRGAAARRMTRLINDNPKLARDFRFTSAEHLIRFVSRWGGERLGQHAAGQLSTSWPLLSAAPRHGRRNIAPVAGAALATLAALFVAPAPMVLAAELTLAALFLAWLAFRLFGATVEWPRPSPSAKLADDQLPVYTIIAALYHEAKSVDGLLNAIERFDYPREKLDVKLVIEPDDPETPAAIAKRKSRLPIEVITAPPIGPRTKPKALNVALPFARGVFTVVYDAEDRPEPNQLHRAVQAFSDAGDELACVQACLSIDNTADSWLTRGIMAQTPQAQRRWRPHISRAGG